MSDAREEMPLGLSEAKGSLATEQVRDLVQFVLCWAEGLHATYGADKDGIVRESEGLCECLRHHDSPWTDGYQFGHAHGSECESDTVCILWRFEEWCTIQQARAGKS